MAYQPFTYGKASVPKTGSNKKTLKPLTMYQRMTQRGLDALKKASQAAERGEDIGQGSAIGESLLQAPNLLNLQTGLGNYKSTLEAGGIENKFMTQNQSLQKAQLQDAGFTSVADYIKALEDRAGTRKKMAAETLLNPSSKQTLLTTGLRGF